MTKVSNEYLEGIVTKGYVVHDGGVYSIKEVVEMAKELQDARKTLGKLKRISSAKTYIDNKYEYLPGFARSQAKKLAIAEVSDAVGNYIFTDAVHHEGIDTIIAGIYVLDNSK